MYNIYYYYEVKIVDFHQLYNGCLSSLCQIPMSIWLLLLTKVWSDLAWKKPRPSGTLLSSLQCKSRLSDTLTSDTLNLRHWVLTLFWKYDTSSFIQFSHVLPVLRTAVQLDPTSPRASTREKQKSETVDYRLAVPAEDSANQDNVSGINPLVNQRMSQNKGTHQSTSNPGFVCFKLLRGDYQHTGRISGTLIRGQQ